MIIFGLFLYPVSEHSFVINAANKLFFARTNREDVFVPKEDTKATAFMRSKILSSAEVSEVETHRKIVVSPWDNFKLYLNRSFEGCLRNHWWNCISEKDS